MRKGGKTGLGIGKSKGKPAVGKGKAQGKGSPRGKGTPGSGRRTRSGGDVDDEGKQLGGMDDADEHEDVEKDLREALDVLDGRAPEAELEPEDEDLEPLPDNDDDRDGDAVLEESEGDSDEDMQG